MKKKKEIFLNLYHYLINIVNIKILHQNYMVTHTIILTACGCFVRVYCLTVDTILVASAYSLPSKEFKVLKSE